MHVVHLVGFYLLLLSLMHGTMNLKFANAKQAKETYEYRNIKQKLHKTTAAIWFNNVHLVGFYLLLSALSTSCANMRISK
jgi:hypothetical protein